MLGIHYVVIVWVLAPKSAVRGVPSSSPANGWKRCGGEGLGRVANVSSGGPGVSPGVGHGGGHWRGGLDALPQLAHGRGERGVDFGAGRGDCDRDWDRDGGQLRDERD
ncbi:hypothetical protein BGW80DRAFT_1346954 [Lactifluus volemus]|nr:hypothetical protein BGW80DRAFT_1346954 [Lactifluus volemus]